MTGFWAAKRVLLTGDTGFKGSWLKLWLTGLGANVTGLALAPPTEPSLHEALWPGEGSRLAIDIRDKDAVRHRVVKADPDIVFHLAAQPLVRAGYVDPMTTFETNVQGTINLLDALRATPSLRTIVVVTTDKVYRNDESGRPFVEDDPLGGHDPYSASKAAAEIVAESFRKSFFAPRGIGVATARAGNVIGGGDWAEDRLIPYAVRAFLDGESLEVRRPEATRPWQHVLEPLAGYRMLAEQLTENPDLAGAYNFGPEAQSVRSVRDVLEQSVRNLGFGKVNFATHLEGPHEAGHLALDIAKARKVLGFAPRFSFEQTVARTWAWYRGFADGIPALDLCRGDLAAFGMDLPLGERMSA